jgi:hypothetical protein
MLTTKMKTKITLALMLAALAVNAQFVTTQMVTNYAAEVVVHTNRVAVSVHAVAPPVTLDVATVNQLFAGLAYAGISFDYGANATNTVRFSGQRRGTDYVLSVTTTNASGQVTTQERPLPSPVLGAIAATWTGPQSAVPIGTNNLIYFGGAQSNGAFVVNFRLK